MSKKIKALETYTAAAKAVADFKDKHKKTFSAYDALLVEVSEAEAGLKAYVKDEVKGNIANEFVKVTYSPSFKRYYDPSVIMDKATPKVKKAIIDAGGLTKTIDAKVFEDLVEKGEVPVELKQAAFREVEQAPKVGIKEAR